MAGLQRVRAQGERLGRPRAHIPVREVEAMAQLSINEAAAALRVSRSTLKRWRKLIIA
jgi:transposase-like protein